MAKKKYVMHQTGKTNINLDEELEAFHPGKRVTEWGSVYYEYRRNRSDMNRNKRL